MKTTCEACGCSTERMSDGTIRTTCNIIAGACPQCDERANAMIRAAGSKAAQLHSDEFWRRLLGDHIAIDTP